MSSPAPVTTPTAQKVAEVADRLTANLDSAPFDGGTVRIDVDDLRTLISGLGAL